MRTKIRNRRSNLLGIYGWLVALILASQSFASAQIQMIGRRDYLLPGLPGSLLTDDFNGDGRNDIAVADGVVTIFLQAADGSFDVPVNYPAGTSARIIAKGDFNHDGFGDLAVSDGTTATVSVLLGNGDGTFRAAVSYPVPAVASGLAVADLNRDGRQDLLVMSSAVATSFTVLLGKGDGTFGPGSTSVVDAHRSGSILQMADLNRDGKWDAVFVSPGWVSVLLGHGDGTFARAEHYTISSGTQPAGLSVADFNGDGVLDLAEVDSQEAGSMLLGNGDGTFQPQFYFYGPVNSDYSCSADFNGDGKQDLAVVSYYSQEVMILAGNGDGTFHSLSTTPIDPQCCTLEPVPMIVADVNGGHRADILVTNVNGNTGSITLLKGLGDGSFEKENNINLHQNLGSQLVATDVNSDGKMDFVVTNGNQMLALLGTGTGTFEPPLASPFTGSIYSYSSNGFVVGRVNADANRDVVFSDGSNNTIDFLFGNGRGYFGAQTNLSFPDSPGNVYRADFNGDGILDLVLTGFTNYILLGKGHATFSAPMPLNSPGSVIAVADFNGDGRPDLLLEQSGDFIATSLEVMLGNGDGTFQSAVATNVSNYISIVAAGDLNRDGKADLVLTYQASNPVGTPPAVLLSNGDGTFGSPLPFSLPDETVVQVQIADMNRDGNPDLAVVMLNSVVVLLEGNGQGHFGTESAYGVSGGPPSGLIVADLNGDGKPDVATNNGSSISILFQGK